ncbi:hypothetical protein L1987_63801 [Smallanthus sonchifolius]|uniref:Uncharacterized protein n=1 Tax=Smallanthus sonchifolius TaxID=185202 RepID=A0ACB9CEB6_9ASTR|nr:hypothetical protein L1987_63801 [Smallanthus sonchifolius]
MAHVDHAFSISDEDIVMESDSVYTEDEKRDGEGDNGVLTVDLTLMQALLHACTALSLKPSIEWIAASDLEDESAKLTPEIHTKAWETETLRNSACVLVPGGFGDRGVTGMILAAKYACENKVPYLGICLGMHISVIEISIAILGWKGPNSTEFDEHAPNLVVISMPELAELMQRRFVAMELAFSEKKIEAKKNWLRALQCG